MTTKPQLLSAEMTATAEAIRNIRQRLSSIIAECGIPTFVIPADLTTVLVSGLSVAYALERMAEVYRS
jgi:hypothetical protein